MTKKILHTIKGDGKQEFLIPISSKSGLAFMGVKSAKLYERGILGFSEYESKLLGYKR